MWIQENATGCDGNKKSFLFITIKSVSSEAVSPGSFSCAEDSKPEDSNSELEEAVRSEREYVRERLRQELGREPTDEELDEWLRQHTEGY